MSVKAGALPPAPEQGQLVEVRRRQFVVSDVERSANGDGSSPQHLVMLTSVEDDALGDTLRVIWEIEPGARVIEKAGLPRPDAFDNPARLGAFLHAVRWAALTDADYQALQSPFRSGISIEDYQLDPVVRALQMPRANLLIADDVGLGKTIEAGLVIQELILRQRARTVLIVCPASLQIKWRNEMRDKFGLEFRIVDTESLKQLRRDRGIHTNPWTHFPRLITSVDWLKRDIPLRRFRDILPPHPKYPRPFDILVVDEAHHVAPAVTDNYILDTQRTKAIRTLAPHFEHRLFLTATPHNGFSLSFTSLLELLDDQRFARGIPLDQERLGTVLVRRLKDDIVDWKGERKFPERDLDVIEVDYTKREREIHAVLSAYTKSREKAIREKGESHATEFVLKLLKKRLFSSPAAFATTLEKHRNRLAGKASIELRPRPKLLKRALEKVEEEYADDQSLEESLDDAVETATGYQGKLSAEETRLLDLMSEWANENRDRSDSKAKALIGWLDERLRDGDNWTDQRVIIFTEYRATQSWLVNILAARGYSGDRLMTIYGGMDEDKREKIKAAFQADPHQSDVRVLVATDAASEGIDLQSHCDLMVHMEVPWNPNRLEQRIGRVDRHGQRSKFVHIYHFVGKGYEARAKKGAKPGDLEGDLEFLMRAAIKVNSIREDLGRVGPVIASQVEEAMLGKRADLNTVDAEREAEAVRKVLKIERDIRAKIEKLHQRLHDSRRHLQITPDNVRGVVEVGLELAGQPRMQPRSLRGTDKEVYWLQGLGGAWARCLEGLPHPHTGERRPVTFDQDIIEGRDNVVFVHLEHRLSQMCMRLLRSEIWAPEAIRKLERVTARVAPSDKLDEPAVIAHARLVIVGGDRHRLHEEILDAGGAVRKGRFSRLGPDKIAQALEAATDELPPKKVLDDLKDMWDKLEEPLQAALEARMATRINALEPKIEDRKKSDLQAMRTTLEDLGKTIEKELSELDPERPQLWTTEEQQELKRNLASLEARVAAIPAEIKKEEEAIEKRYDAPTPRLFPAAVTFLVPDSMVD